MAESRSVAGFDVHAANAGIKDDSLDFVLIASSGPATVAGVFTRSRFAGPSVDLSRAAVADGTAAALVVVSKNANVANGPAGIADAEELQRHAAAVVGCAPSDVVVASTGVIGRRYPLERLRAHLDGLTWPASATSTLRDAATAIMTTDTVAKLVSHNAGPAQVVGIAKGVGMIEPDMATLLVFVFTDASCEAATLDAMWRRVVDRTFNALSIDTDTSTSDTAVVFASGLAGDVDPDVLEAAIGSVALDLVRMIAGDGEGASKSIEVTVSGARDDTQARRVAKAIVNSPLVKTAVHGADPNWGRIAMAIGKLSDETDISQDRVTIRIGDVELFPTPVHDADALAAAAEHMAGTRVLLAADLGIADGTFTVYGCDLTEGYIRINADYTT